MKRVLILLAALCAATSCSESFEQSQELTTTPMTDISMRVLAEASTRVDVDNQTWEATWTQGDQLTAWASTSQSTHTLAMDVYDSKASTFSGSVPADETLRLIYEADANVAYSASTASLDISAQTSGVKTTVMVSSDLISDASAAPLMVHVGAAMVLNLSFESVATTMNITAVELLDVPSTIDLNLLEGVDGNFYSNSTNGSIMVTLAEPIAISTDSTTASVAFNILPFDVAPAQSVGVKVYFEDTTDTATPFYIETSVTNSSEDYTVSFKRATYNIISCSCDMNNKLQVYDSSAVWSDIIEKNLVINGDYENAGTVTVYWSNSNTNWAKESNASNVINGTYSLRLTGVSANSYINQYVYHAVPGETYKYGCTYRCGAAAGASGSQDGSTAVFIGIRYSADGSTFTSLGSISTSSGTDTTVGDEVTIPEDAVLIQVQVGKTSGIAYIDDVYFGKAL